MEKQYQINQIAMAAIKSYTDLSQSKTLSKILPLESADMYWFRDDTETPKIYPKDMMKDSVSVTLPCWSLAALLGVLPNEIISNNMFECHYQIDIRKYDGGNNTTLYQIAYGNNSGFSSSWHDMISTGEKENLIDCCVQMIIKLHELKKL